VSGGHAFDLAILGAGPAGLTAALIASRSMRVVLVADRIPGRSPDLRIEAIPARTLAMLTELGVEPSSLGAAALHDGHWSSWETDAPQFRASAPTAHIERPALERALFARVCEERIAFLVEPGAPHHDGSDFWGPGWRAAHLIDATGRAAITARKRVAAAHPWASRFFWSGNKERKLTDAFAIAPLRDGYAYRIGSGAHIGLGLVGRSRLLRAAPERIAEILRAENALWLLDGLPPLARMRIGASGPCSVQWAVGSRALLIGDAALARDALSSQGLAGSLSDAFHAVEAILSGDPGRLAERHAANRTSHLALLNELVGRNRTRDAPLWREYADHVRRRAVVNPSGRLAELRPAAAQ
jgi:2-polyprenyl-6-methoxyphenol hydroxylase-like FAD-dependent oxidoreductase